MKSCSRLLEMYRAAEPKQIDTQVILSCSNGTYVPLDTIVEQFKTLVKYHYGSAEYKTVRAYLVSIFSEQIINDLEAV